MNMSLKYSSAITVIPDCPPSTCKPVGMEAYRFVHADANHQNNFLPPKLINPKRDFSDNRRKCSACALSLFTTEENAKSAFRHLLKKYKNIANTLGDHLAVGRIAPVDGIASPPDSGGHFDLFEAIGANLAPKFKTLGPILP